MNRTEIETAARDALGAAFCSISFPRIERRCGAHDWSVGVDRGHLPGPSCVCHIVSVDSADVYLDRSARLTFEILDRLSTALRTKVIDFGQDDEQSDSYDGSHICDHVLRVRDIGSYVPPAEGRGWPCDGCGKTSRITTAGCDHCDYEDK